MTHNLTKALILAACAVFFANCSSSNSKKSTAVWYINPTQNNAENLYGVAQGSTLEEATKYALADAAARLMVSVSSETNMISEENQTSVNEEIRRNVRQNVEKIEFSNFKVTKSDKVGENFFVEISIDRSDFISLQKEKIRFLNKQISDLEENLSQKNIIQKRAALVKILDLLKQAELGSRIIIGSGQSSENINLQKILDKSANFQNQLNKILDKIEFSFSGNVDSKINEVIKNSLNKEKIKITKEGSNSNQNQVSLHITTSYKTEKIYEAYITKLSVFFENISGGKVIASNKVEVTGNSSISEKESKSACAASLEEKISKDGILKTLGF